MAGWVLVAVISGIVVVAVAVVIVAIVANVRTGSTGQESVTPSDGPG